MDTIGISQTDFLSGGISMTFDLEKARDALDEPICPAGQHRVVLELQGALAEIERLRADYDKLKSSLLVIDGCKKLMNQAARIDELEADNQNLVTLNKSLMNNDWILRDNNRKYRKRAQKAELLNKELKADLEQSEEIKRLKDELENYGDHYACLLISKDAQIKELGGMLSIRTEELDIAHSVARSEKEMHEKELAAFARRIKELEDALVEGLTNFLHYRASCYDPARRCPHAKECDDCSTWDACGHVEKFRSEARRRLQAEGKIGPDATKPQSWQITEERIGLLEYCLETLLDLSLIHI